jgi:uncharacterized membrane protein YhfC
MSEVIECFGSIAVAIFQVGALVWGRRVFGSVYADLALGSVSEVKP